MSKDQVRRAIHVKRFSSAHEPQVGLSSLSSKNHKSSSVVFVSNSQRFRDKELELLAVLANILFFFSFLFFCLSAETRIIVLNPRRCPADLFSHVDYCSICYTGPLYCHILFNLNFFIYLFRAEKQEREGEVGRRVNRRRGAEK